MPTEPEANAGTPSAHGELLLADKPEEHIVWQRGIEPLLMWVSDNARRICAYGFTEMLNNAIDHSEGTRIRYFMDVEQRMIRFTIRDDGIGVFEKIRSRFKLEDHRLAMLELSKGKLTTDSSRHSGQGIFFTSRMFDYFLLGSNGLSFSHTAGADDWLIETGPFDQPGTVVIMEIQADSRRTTRQVFDMFADPDIDDYSFSRTHVPLKLARFGTSELVSRSEAKRVLARFEGFREVLLDFDGIESIGQAFADEIFRVFRLAHPEINVIAVRENEPVRQMVDRARAQALAQAAEAVAAPLVIPTVRELLEEIRAGRETRAMIPVPAGRNLAPGDLVIFAEATFSPFGTPSLIDGGQSLSVALTKAEDTGGIYQTARIFGIGWEPVARDAGAPAQAEPKGGGNQDNGPCPVDPPQT